MKVSQDPDLDPVADDGVEGVLVPDIDLAPPVEQHVLLGLCVKHVEGLDPGPESELAHLQPPPPGPYLRHVQPDPPERGQQVRGDGEQDGVERNLSREKVENCNAAFNGQGGFYSRCLSVVSSPCYLPAPPPSPPRDRTRVTQATCTTCPGHVTPARGPPAPPGPPSTRWPRLCPPRW